MLADAFIKFIDSFHRAKSIPQLSGHFVKSPPFNGLASIAANHEFDILPNRIPQIEVCV